MNSTVSDEQVIQKQVVEELWRTWPLNLSNTVRKLRRHRDRDEIAPAVHKSRAEGCRTTKRPFGIPSYPIGQAEYGEEREMTDKNM